MNNASIRRTILAGLLGGLAINVTMVLTFRLAGFGWRGGGILMDPTIQSKKLITVWTEPPRPRVLDEPAPLAIMAGLLAFGVLHAFLYRALSAGWPAGVARRAIRLAAWVFGVCFLFWEFFTPFNQLHEPLPLLALELLFWAIIALADGFAIAAVMERRGATRADGASGA